MAGVPPGCDESGDVVMILRASSAYFGLGSVAMPEPLLVSFVGGHAGPWCVERMATITGTGLAEVARIAVHEGRTEEQHPGTWTLRGVTSNERYVERPERTALVERQEGLGRHDATCAALIPITKSAQWWELTQDERRSVFEARSRHIAIGLQYLPGIARRLHHGRDLGEAFDFLTWFEYGPADQPAFEDLVGRLRETEEWSFVDREIDIRLTR
jgi:Chlorite dismutase